MGRKRRVRVRSSGTVPWRDGELLAVKPRSEGGSTVLAVGRRVGGAVIRNRLKRRLRHLCRELAVKGVVVVARPAAASASFALLRQEMARLNDMA